MTVTIRVVDIEALIGSYLRSLDIRAVGKTPDDTTDNFVRVTMISAPTSPVSNVDWFTPFTVQLDCYAGNDQGDSYDGSGGQPEANNLARDVREALMDMPNVAFDEGVVTAVRSNMSRIPDTSLEPARERVIIISEVYAHPNP